MDSITATAWDGITDDESLLAKYRDQSDWRGVSHGSVAGSGLGSHRKTASREVVAG